jgi:hypothetical protein
MAGDLVAVELRVLVVVGRTDRVPVGVRVVVREGTSVRVAAADGDCGLVGSIERVPVPVLDDVRLAVAVSVPYAASPAKKRP